MSKKKLKLEELRVDSFSTQLSENDKIMLNGGTTPTCLAGQNDQQVLEINKESDITICPQSDITFCPQSNITICPQSNITICTFGLCPI